MKIENLYLFGLVYRKKQPKEWTFNGRSGYTYSVQVDTGEEVHTLKVVKEEEYNNLIEGKKYAFICDANLDPADASKCNVTIVAHLNGFIEASDSFKIVSADSLTKGRTAKPTE